MANIFLPSLFWVLAFLSFLAEDADLEKLLKKLPGFEIVDGKIMAQGQEVKKITIDGMEYAINDPAAA